MHLSSSTNFTKAGIHFLPSALTNSSQFPGSSFLPVTSQHSITIIPLSGLKIARTKVLNMNPDIKTDMVVEHIRNGYEAFKSNLLPLIGSFILSGVFASIVFFAVFMFFAPIFFPAVGATSAATGSVVSSILSVMLISAVFAMALAFPFVSSLISVYSGALKGKVRISDYLGAVKANFRPLLGLGFLYSFVFLSFLPFFVSFGLSAVDRVMLGGETAAALEGVQAFFGASPGSPLPLILLVVGLIASLALFFSSWIVVLEGSGAVRAVRSSVSFFLSSDFLRFLPLLVVSFVATAIASFLPFSTLFLMVVVPIFGIAITDFYLKNRNAFK